MELWIRSQDKRNLKKINTEIYIKKGLSNYAEGDVYFIVSSGTELGEYKTKERALEVLDEIQHLFIEKEPFKTELTKDGLTIMTKQPSSIVYEMPKE